MRIFKLLSISVLLFCFSAQAGDRLVMLLSLGTKTAEIRLQDRMERIFRAHLGPKANIRVLRKTDQWDLFRELNDPENRAVFWVSHAAYLNVRTKKGSSRALNLSPGQMISDYRGDNVASIFKSTHANLKFVAVIGCHADEILKDLEPQSFLAHGKVRGPKNLKKAISKFKEAMSRDDDRPSTAESGSKVKDFAGNVIKVRRSMPTDAPPKWIRSLRVVQGGRILGMIPSVLPGEARDFYIPLGDHESNIPLEVQSAQGVGTPTDKIIFGDLSVSYQDRDYQLFVSPSGAPFGKTMRVFLP